MVPTADMSLLNDEVLLFILFFNFFYPNCVAINGAWKQIVLSEQSKILGGPNLWNLRLWSPKHEAVQSDLPAYTCSAFIHKQGPTWQLHLLSGLAEALPDKWGQSDKCFCYRHLVCLWLYKHLPLCCCGLHPVEWMWMSEGWLSQFRWHLRS